MSSNEIKRWQWIPRQDFLTELIGGFSVFSTQAVGFILTYFFLRQFKSAARWKNLRLPFLLYLFWAWVLDKNISKKGGRPSKWLRKNPLFKGYRNYFPASIELDFPKSEIRTFFKGADGEERPFVLACHPHGIISHGIAANLLFHHDTLDFLNFRCGTITFNVTMPFWRDILLASGVVEATPEALSSCLQQGISIAIVPGGAEEALDARPGHVDLTLQGRKGFVRLALQNGAGLVPVFSFGENELYKQLVPNPPGSFIRKLQTLGKKLTGFSLPSFRGRWFTPIPFRKPLITVIGRPIDVQTNEKI